MDIAIVCGGVHPATAKRWEDGLIPQQYLPTLAAFLGVDVPYLAGWVEEAAA